MNDWTTYKNEFVSRAEELRYSKKYIDICLRYAIKFIPVALPVIYDQEHFAQLVGYDFYYVNAAYYSTKSFYRTYHVDKISGGQRQISEPLPSLKEIQRWILDKILYQCEISKFCKGFVPGLSIRDNARFHRRQPKVLSMDIQDFFPSIKAGRIYNFFWRLGYQKKVSHLLTKLCTLSGSLPQGAPTSPALSNLISIRMDRRLAGFALKENIRYTRYADDITFSGNLDAGKFVNFTRKVLKDEGYALHEKKTRLMENHQRQEVTGIVVNRHLQAPRDIRREFRQTMHFVQKYGIESHIEHKKIKRANYVKHLLGIGNFILFANPKDDEIKEYIAYLHQILKEQGF